MAFLERSKKINIGEQITYDMINKENIKLYQKYKRDMQLRELSEKSIMSYEYDIKAWFRYIVENQFNQSITELDEDDIEEYIYYCKENGNNTERIKRRMASVSAFYKFLRRKKIIKENPCEFIARPKKGLPIVTQTFLTVEQWEQIKEKLKEFNDTQLSTYVYLSMSTMARVNAISSIRWSQIDFDNRTIDDVLEKEGKIVTLFFSDEVKDLLLQLKEEREKEGINIDYVFITHFKGEYKQVTVSTLQEWTKKVGESIGVPTLHPHDWRHSGATILKSKGMDLEDVSFLLNHSSVDVTRKFYIKEDKSKIVKMKDKFEI